jgi:hypothetical protein
MIEAEFKTDVGAFLKYLNQKDFGYQLEYDEEIENKILNHYLPEAQKKSTEIKRQCIEIMQKSCELNGDHQHLVEWKGALVGIIWFCIVPTESFHEIEEYHKETYDAYHKTAISSVIRFSRWYHTQAGFWSRFKPYAQKIGKLLWGDMEELNKYNA